MISLIFALDESNLLGNGLYLPWSVKEDLRYYKNKVKDQDILMGYNTYMSLKYYYNNQILPYKKIYLITSRLLIVDENVQIIRDLQAFLRLKKAIFVVGGLMVFRVAIAYADYIYLSRIKGVYKGDIYYHDLDLSAFALINEHKTDLVTYQVYKRAQC